MHGSADCSNEGVKVMAPSAGPIGNWTWYTRRRNTTNGRGSRLMATATPRCYNTTISSTKSGDRTYVVDCLYTIIVSSIIYLTSLFDDQNVCIFLFNIPTFVVLFSRLYLWVYNNLLYMLLRKRKKIITWLRPRFTMILWLNTLSHLTRYIL